MCEHLCETTKSRATIRNRKDSPPQFQATPASLPGEGVVCGLREDLCKSMFGFQSEHLTSLSLTVSIDHKYTCPLQR